MARPRDLLNRYRPILVYDSREVYGAGPVEMLTDTSFAAGPCKPYANALRRANGSPIAVAGGDPGLTIDFLCAGTYSNGEEVLSSDFLDAANTAYVADARMWRTGRRRRPPVYGRELLHGDGQRWLQYWIFYYFNSKQLLRLGLHEGDWEMIQLGLNSDGAPESATYAQHGAGEGAEWSDVEVDDSTGAPVVYVARGSHASLFRSGSHEAPVVDDYSDGKGTRERPHLKRLSAEPPAWLDWPGKWGASREGWFQSPAGPAFQDAWTDPDRFYREASTFTPPRGRRRAVAAKPAVVDVRVTERGDRRVVEYTVAGAAAGPDAKVSAELAVIVSPHGDREPERFVYEVSTAGVKRPLPPP
jgi:hypothetical protein